MLAGMRVVTADRGGTIRESLAMGQVYAQARQQQGGSELLDELVSSPPSLDPNRMREAGGEIGKVSGEGLREALRLLEEKASPEEVEAYRGFVRDVADAVARAHKEGGVLGIGGKEVSPDEQKALDEIEAALG